MAILKSLSLLFLIVSVFGVELQQPIVDLEGEPPVDFEHENILGSHKLASEFHTFDEAESSKRLAEILTQMDTDGDKSISTAELSAWILNAMKKLDEEEVFETFNNTDQNKDGFVTWDEFLNATYHTDKERLAHLELLYPVESVELKKQVSADEQKFMLADNDRDGKLSLSEFAAMTHPYHFDYMNVHDVENVRKQYDLDGNGVVSKVEFLSYGIEERQELEAHDFKDSQEALRDEFESIDLDNNGVLDDNEIKEWIAPGLEGVAKQEAGHMFSETDVNKDGKLTFEEVLARTAQWVGSKASSAHQHTFHHKISETPKEAQAQTPVQTPAPAEPAQAEPAPPKPEL